MFRVRIAVATAVAVASVMCCASFHARAAAATPSFLLFGGTDLWRYGGFLYGGTLWAPQGLDNDGLALKALLNGGRYSYISGDRNGEVRGTLAAVAALPGWRWVRPDFAIGLFAGPVMQDYRLAPNDPGSRLRGLYAGGQFATEIWYQPTPATMAALSGAIVSIGPTGTLRAAVGVRAFDAYYVGPETAAHWCANFQELQFGAHLTGWRLGTVEWSSGAGWALTSDHRAGPYLRIGLNARY